MSCERYFLSLMLFLSACSVCSGTLTVTTWGGEYANAQRIAFFEPFSAQSGYRVVQDMWGGDIARIRAMVKRNHYTAGVFDAEEDQVQEGCDSEVLEVIDYDRLDFDRESLVPEADHRCGVGSMVWSMIFAYDPTKFASDAPTNWRDFWDMEKFPGKRGLYGGLETNLEIALLADGVDPLDVYAELATDQGRTRAFNKLNALKPHIIWWQAGVQAGQLLRDSEVVMTSGWNGRLYRASTSQRHFPLVWQGQLMFFAYWVIPKDHPNRKIAYDFISLATRPERQAKMTQYIPYGPTHKEWTTYIDPSIVKDFPTAPDNLKLALKVRPGYWRDHTKELRRMFTTWMNK